MEYKQTVNVPRIILSIAITLGVATTLGVPVFAEGAGGNVQGYSAKSPLDAGTIVQLTDSDTRRVEIATQAKLQRMFGIVIDRAQSPLTMSSEGLENETFVAVSGTYTALVSTQGGPIASGDHLTLSSIDGVLMKASTKEETVFGRAGSSFDGKGVVLGTTSLKDTNGNDSRSVSLGSMPVTIDIKQNPNVKSTEVKVPNFLERVGQAIAEKQVSPIRIYLSMAITAISIIAAIVILYSGVRSSMISIGRNPMSKKSIFRALIEIILTSILILIIGLFAVYLLLKL